MNTFLVTHASIVALIATNVIVGPISASSAILTLYCKVTELVRAKLVAILILTSVFASSVIPHAKRALGRTNARLVIEDSLLETNSASVALKEIT